MRWLPLLALAGCADSIRPEPEDVTDAAPPPPGVIRIDATDPEGWAEVDLDEDGVWDLAAQRFHLKLNGGVSGDAGVETAPRPGTLGDVTAPPDAGWLTDQPDGDDDDAEPDYAFEQGDGWYAYDAATHVLTPRPLVWVLRGRALAPLALVIDDYYDDAGTSGVFTVRWAPL